MNKVSKRMMLSAVMIVVTVFSTLSFVAVSFAETPPDVNMQLSKLNYILRAVRDNYVENPDQVKLLDGAIRGLLEELDPHSVYIPAKEQEKISEQFRGEFEGIGIQFTIQNKWLTVVSPIQGTPSERLGIRSGDRITRVNGLSAYGITSEEVQEKLRGPKGSTVDVTIARPGLEVPLEFTIVRDKIPIYSVSASFLMPDKETGYIRVNQFTAHTEEEVRAALDSLKRAGMTRLMFDLRSNPGGYLDQAWKVADLFIPEKDKLIVYTKGRTDKSNTEFRTTGRGINYDMPLVVLINHGSASASEIVSGAVQDHDRGLVVGEVSFGKGLVQTPYPMPDGSVVRLTTARYYTPSGRLIQREYGDNIYDYLEEGHDDIDPNAPADTTKKEIFYTGGGRIVYGGGGITPDSTVHPEKTNSQTAKLFSQRLYFKYATNYTVKHPDITKDINKFANEFEVTDPMLSEFRELLTEKEFEVDEKMWDEDIAFTKNTIRGEIASLIFNDRNAYHLIKAQGDAQVQTAMSLFDQAKSMAATTTEKAAEPRQ